ncbi:MAG: PadR family transcriptional regulator [Myxococcales bacterium]|nr:PadR family transcriptional regulator [Myxococcales bacterium]
MARSTDAPSRIEILVLSTLARLPLHGYELKTELRYRHVRWWAKCEHGHLYAALSRLERRGFVAQVSATDSGSRRVYRITPAGLRRVKAALWEIGDGEDATYFDLDLFLAGCYLMEQAQVVRILEGRTRRLRTHLAEARALRETMSAHVPAVGRLVMDHRIQHLEGEAEFTSRAARELEAQPRWGAFLGKQRIGDFVKRTGVPLERAAAARAAR